MTVTLTPARTSGAASGAPGGTGTPGALIALGDLAAAYALASRLFLAPADGGLLASLAASPLLAAWPLSRCEETVRGLASLHRSLTEREDAAALAGDYEQLFVTREACVPAPCESAYRPFEHLDLDLPPVEVTDERHVLDLTATGAERREGDHVGVEFAHAGRLCLAAAEAARRGDGAGAARYAAAHRSYLAEHLMRWAPGCLRETEADATTHFYRGAAALALGVLAHAHERLG